MLTNIPIFYHSYVAGKKREEWKNGRISNNKIKDEPLKTLIVAGIEFKFE